MARDNDDRKKLLEALTEAPLISHACRKLGISRATFYRWKKDSEFEKEVQYALGMGREKICDTAEAALLKKVQEGEFAAIKFVLQHNDIRYAAKRPLHMHHHAPGCEVCDKTGSIKQSAEQKRMADRAIETFLSQRRQEGAEESAGIKIT